MNERFWTTEDPDYWDNRFGGRDDRHYGQRMRNDDDRGHYRGMYGDHDPSFYHGGFRDERDMGRMYNTENFGSSGYGHSGQVSSRDRYYDDRRRYRDEYRGNRNEGRYNDQRYNDQRNWEDERFGESHQHRHHARTSDTWDRPAAYNRGGYGNADFGRDSHGRSESNINQRWSDRGNRDFDRGYYDDRGYHGQGYEDIHRWRGW